MRLLDAFRVRGHTAGAVSAAGLSEPAKLHSSAHPASEGLSFLDDRRPAYFLPFPSDAGGSEAPDPVRSDAEKFAVAAVYPAGPDHADVGGCLFHLEPVLKEEVSGYGNSVAGPEFGPIVHLRSSSVAVHAILPVSR